MVYANGSSITTEGGLVVVYPVPGLVIAILTILPPLIAAVPINSILGGPVLKVWTPTLTTVWIPDL